MRDMDREIGIGQEGEPHREPRDHYRDRLLMVDEMEETAQAIRAKAAGFDDVAEDQARQLETALQALRADLSRRGAILD
jgi:hypothetical protein